MTNTAMATCHNGHIDWEEKDTDNTNAETCYTLMLNTIDAGHDAITFLMSDSKKAGEFRSLLIGRSANAPTSWQDQYD